MVDHIYTSMEDAREEIYYRWNGPFLRKKVAAFVSHVPQQFINQPRAILNRDVATPDNEFREFIKKACQIGLSPIVSEYWEDKFVGINPDKLSLAKMPIYSGKDKNGNTTFRYKTVVDCTKYDGKKFSIIKTLWGEYLVDFHHRLVGLHYPDVEIFDYSAWIKSKGNRAREFYLYELALCICHGILFENFVSFGAEKIFCTEIVKPTIEKLTEIFGLKPLIVPLVSEGLTLNRSVHDIYWSCYPPSVEDEILRRLPIPNIHNKSTHMNERIGMAKTL